MSYMVDHWNRDVLLTAEREEPSFYAFFIGKAVFFVIVYYILWAFLNQYIDTYIAVT